MGVRGKVVRRLRSSIALGASVGANHRPQARRRSGGVRQRPQRQNRPHHISGGKHKVKGEGWGSGEEARGVAKGSGECYSGWGREGVMGRGRA